MRKIKEKAFWKVSFLIEQLKTQEKFFKSGIEIIIGLLIAVTGITVIALSNSHHYSEISITPTKFFNMLDTDNGKINQEMTLIIYHTDCPACQKLENKIVRGVIQKENEDSRREYVAVDVKAMTGEQLKSVKEKFPDLLVDGNKISTPTVTNIEIEPDGHIQVIDKNTNGDMSKILKILNSTR